MTVTSLTGRIEELARRPRKPLELRRRLLEAAARVVWAPAWLIGRTARFLAVGVVFFWRAGALGVRDGFGPVDGA